jgi:hypothetical protein
LPFAAAGANIRAGGAMDEATFDYPRMIREALRGVVRQALERVVEAGLPAEHHLFIAFRTGAPGVRVPRFLRDLHPDEISIVLQHQFWDLEVGDDAFSVTLAFGGVHHRLTVPYTAILTFADPAANFGLRFETAAEAAGEGATASGGEGAAAAEATESAAADETGPAPANVVHLDRFRGKD